MLEYWNGTLENLSKDPRNDKFKMIINNKIHEVSLSYALGISPLIAQEYFKDPTLNELYITIKNIKK